MTTAAAGSGIPGSTGGAPCAGAPGAAAAPASGAGAPQSGAPAGSGDWTATLDETARGYVTTKGFKTPGDVLTSYMNAEKLLGVPADQILRLPKADAKAEDWAPVYDRLGRPAKAEDYKIPVPQGQSDALAKAVAPVMHQLGLSQAQAEGLISWWNGQSEGMLKQQATDATAKSNEQAATLAKEWGAAAEQNTGVARAAAQKFGITAEQIDGMQAVLGYDGVMKLFHKIGSGLGEGEFHGGDGSSGFGGVMSPEQARFEIKSLQQDRDWTKKYMSGDAEARRRMEQLQKWANPEQA
jgi:hypothetical protein